MRWVNQNPEKRSAQQILYRAVKLGRVTRPETCSRCGALGRIHAHHPDYTQPLLVEWLCHQCHVDIHAAKAVEGTLPFGR